MSEVASSARWLLAATAIGSAGSLASAILAARWLGVAAFGQAALALSVFVVCQRLCTFETWQVGLRYIPLAEAGRIAWSPRGTVARLALLDLVGAVLTVALALSAGQIFYRHVAGAGAPVDAFMVGALLQFGCLAGTAVAVLRLRKDRKILSLATAAPGIVKLIVVLILGPADLTLGAYLVAVVGIDAIFNLSVVVAAWLIGRGSIAGPGHGPHRHLPRDERREFRRFLSTVYVHSSLKAGIKEADTLLLGLLATPFAAGIYRICRQAGGIVVKAGDPVAQAIFPHVARLVTGGRSAEARRLVARLLRMALAAGAGGMVLYLAIGEPLVALVMGQETAASMHGPLALVLGGCILSLAGICLQGYFIALGTPGHSLRALTAGTVVQLLVAVIAIPLLQATGAALSFLSFYLVWLLYMVRAFRLGRT